MDFYKRIMEWAACVQRLAEFNESLAQLPPLPTPIIQGQTLVCDALQVALPHQPQPCLAPFSCALQPGDWLQLQGPSGIGKSALLRTLAGLWPAYAGKIALPVGNVLFLPQKSYLPFARLDELLCYPRRPMEIQADLGQLLQMVGLAHLSTQLEVARDWALRLSGGEQQRIAFARLLLQRPQVIFCDENTNQLDIASARHLFSLLKQQLPEAIVIAVTHQAELADFFNSQYVLQRG